MIGYLILAFLAGSLVTAVIAALIVHKPLRERKMLVESFTRMAMAVAYAEKAEAEEALDLACTDEEFVKRMDNKLDNLPFEGDENV
jgi:hypothetical protein